MPNPMRLPDARIFVALCLIALVPLPSLGAKSAGAATSAPIIELAAAAPELKPRPNGTPSPLADAALSIEVPRNAFGVAALVLRAANAAATLEFDLSALRSAEGKTIDPAAIGLLRTLNVQVRRASDRDGKAGLWPDPLLPIGGPIELAAGETIGLWLKVRIAASQPAGLYLGVLRIGCPDGSVRTVPVSVRVWALGLPSRPSLPALVGLDYESIARFEGVPLDDPRFTRETLPPYYEILREQGIYPLFVFGARPRIVSTGGATLDMGPYWDALASALGEAVQWAPIAVPFDESFPPIPHAPLSTAWQKEARVYLSAVADSLEANGAIDRAFIYLPFADEPSSREQIATIRRLADFVRSVNPRLRLLQTAHAHCSDCTERTSFEALDHDSLWWAPNLAFANGQAMLRSPWTGIQARSSGWSDAVHARLRSAGHPVWWYLNTWTFLQGSAPRYPDLFIDHPGTRQRAIGWAAFAKGIDGVGYWNVTYWRDTENPWLDLPHGEGGGGTAGDGVLLYPGRVFSGVPGAGAAAGPVTSIRLELLRESLQDHAILSLAPPNLARAEAASLVPSLTAPSADPLAYAASRRRLAEAAVAAAAR